MTETTATAAAKPANKAELLTYTDECWMAFVNAVDALTDEQWMGPTDPAGWSVRDHVAHVTLWDQSVVALLQSQTPIQQFLGVSDAAWHSGSIDPINEEIHQRTIDDSPAAVRTERDRIYAQLADVLAALSEEDLARPADDFGLDEEGKPLLAVLTNYLGEHYDQHHRYIEIIVAVSP